MMTRKDFEAIAESLRKSKASKAEINRMADHCRKSNPRFDYARFVRAATAKK